VSPVTGPVTLSRTMFVGFHGEGGRPFRQSGDVIEW
jgi:hypothetical protein